MSAFDTGASATSRALHILVVDDELSVVRSLEEVLQREGHTIETALGGGEGIRAFLEALKSAAPFDAVITDLGMPLVDGRKVAHMVKAHSPCTRVVMVTGWGKRMLEDGERPEAVDVLLSKPPRLAELRRALA